MEVVVAVRPAPSPSDEGLETGLRSDPPGCYRRAAMLLLG